MRRAVFLIGAAVLLASSSVHAHRGLVRQLLLNTKQLRATDIKTLCPGSACTLSQLSSSLEASAALAKKQGWATFGDFQDGTPGLLTKKRIPTPLAVTIVRHDGVPYAQFRLCNRDPIISGGHRAELSAPPGGDFAMSSSYEYLFSFLIPAGGLYLDPTRPQHTAAVLAQFKGHDGASPAVAVRVRNDGKLYVTADHAGGREIVHSQPVSYDKPTTVKLAVRWSSSDTGRVHAEIEGQRSSYAGPVGHSSSSYYFKYGLYNSGGNVLPHGTCLRALHGPMFFRRLPYFPMGY